MMPPGKSRAELELAWQKRLNVVSLHYHDEAERFREVRSMFPTNGGFGPDGMTAIHHARQRESAALKEYMRVLGIFADLVVRGIVPDEEPD